MENDQGIWMTKDGKKIKISDMSDGHLINSVRLLQRTVGKMRLGHQLSGFSILNFVNGEMAEMAIENALQQEMEMDDEEWLEYHTSYEELIEEAKKRDIIMLINADKFLRLFK